MKKNITTTIYMVFLALLMNTNQLFAQTEGILGMVVDQNQEILVGASLYWSGTDIGVTTNTEGYFNINRVESTVYLVVSYVGYRADTIEIEPADSAILIILSLGTDFEEVQITETQRDNFVSTIQTVNIETIGSGELKKAACCNLSESFETNGSVNVTYSDAVTGAKEIEMLGLRGIYTQMMLENRPIMRGLGYTFGMEYIPGTWVERISVAKGASNVVNGYEGVAGNINIELIKPFEGERVFVNGYANHVGRSELNVHLNKKLKNNWSVGTLLHGSYFQGEVDHNEDSFLDIPKKANLNGLFRAFYRGEDIRGQINVQALTSNHQGGQIGYEDNPEELYGFELLTDRVEIFTKMGYIGFSSPFRSVGWITNATWHRNDGFFGRNDYDATQKSFYTNVIFQDILSTSDHNYKLGASYVYDDYVEDFAGDNYDLTESIVGVFGEYSYVHPESPTSKRGFGVIAGLRADYHNLFGLFVVPRVSAKYNFNENTVVRFNAGRGVRTARILAENISVLTSSRAIEMTETLLPEDAWNTGFNFTTNLLVFAKELSISADAYTTQFTNQVVMDRDTDENKVLFYNLNGRSFSNNFLVSAIYGIYHRTELKLAYKFNDVRVTYNGNLDEMPLVAKHRGLATLSYTTKDKSWKFHTTVQVVGPQRLPRMTHEGHSLEGHGSLAPYHKTGITPTFATLNGQITKIYKKWEFYLGGENLTNYMQHSAIIGASDPFDANPGIPAFDASQVFAPIMGAMIYGGFRFTLK
jgi:hypothetical protein